MWEISIKTINISHELGNSGHANDNYSPKNDSNMMR